MANLEVFYPFERYEKHKGFYNDDKKADALFDIKYTDFFKPTEDDEFPYDTAHELLCGSCNHFALSLKKVLGYNPYIIERKNEPGFHAFCQIYKNKKLYYVDARGITSCFNEFMDIAKIFVQGEYNIRPVTQDDIEDWEKYTNYNNEAYKFAEEVIKKYITCYSI